MTCFKVLHRGPGSFALLFAWAFFSANAMGGDSLLWYDGFSLTDDGGDYTVTTDEIIVDDTVDPPTETRVVYDQLPGQSGGSGTFMTGGPWISPYGEAWVLPTSLERTFEDGNPAQLQPSIGGSVGDDPSVDTGCCHEARDGMEMASPWGGFTDPDGTYYMSFLVNFGTGPTVHHRVLEWWNGDIDDSNRSLQFGISEFSGVGGGTQLALRVTDFIDDLNPVTTEALLTNHATWAEIEGITQAVMLKFDMSTTGQDVVSLYLNPVGGEGENTPDAQIAVDQYLMTTIGTFSTFVYGAGEAPVFDELRVAATWDDAQINMAPHYWNNTVPEPSTVALIGIALGGCLAARRWRRK